MQQFAGPPQKVSAKLRHRAQPYALNVGMAYLLFTWVLFFIGPFEWPLTSWLPALLYVPMIFLVLAISHSSMLGRTPRYAPFAGVKRYLAIGGISAAILLIPSGQVYAGRWPWQVMEALADQRDAYASLREALAASEGTRGPVIFLRTLAAPFVFAALPLGIIHWAKLSVPYRSLVVVAVLSSVVFSVLRGTTRELADIVVASMAAFLVVAARREGRSIFTQHWGKITAGILAIFGVFFALVGRAEARLGSTTISCAGETGVCANLATGFYGSLSDSFAFGAAMITGYLSQGYYGLSLAMTLPFDTTWGIGHSPAMETLYRSLTQDVSLYQNAYTFKLRSLGWSDEYQWSSLMVWLANDVSFFGVPFLIALLGLAWGASWVDATRGQDDRAAVFFCVLMAIVFYLPLSNQMMGVVENYFVVAFWAAAWLWSRKRAVVAR